MVRFDVDRWDSTKGSADGLARLGRWLAGEVGPWAAWLEEQLAASPDPERAAINLDRFAAAVGSPGGEPPDWLRTPDLLADLLRLFATSQYFSDLIVGDPALAEMLLPARRAALRPEQMLRELEDRLDGVDDPAEAGRRLRRFRHRHLLRIGAADVLGGQPFEVVVDQISHLADVVVEAAVRFTRKRLEARLGIPRNHEGRPCAFAVLALGKLGGSELNYSSDIDLMLLYECEGTIRDRRPVSHQEFFNRLATDLVKLLAEHTSDGVAYRIDLRLRPEGTRGPLTRTLDSAVAYYDLHGRTWERQALIKLRAIAGDRALGEQFINRIEPWIYRRYLNTAEINGIKALKRRIENRTASAGEDQIEVKTGRGGIRDVEFCTQFLQLLNGGDLPQVRTPGTLRALERLRDVGCLTLQEHAILAETYQFLRRIEHRLQTMFDLQTHRLPREPGEMRKLALRLGYRDDAKQTAQERFGAEYRLNARLNRTILNHLLHDAFPEDDRAGVEPEFDLVLDPYPEHDLVERVLGRYRFRDIPAAHANLMQLGRESVRYLSTPRCRHFLASIAPRLLQAISQKPDPDQVLVNLVRVSESIGGKAVLWELFHWNPPSLKLYVDLCAGSQLLTDVLIGNPGMIDELMDSLDLNVPRTLEELKSDLHPLCRGAADPRPTLQGFKLTETLRIGVRDILGKNDLQDTLAALTNLAEAILCEIARIERDQLLRRWGQPCIGSGSRGGMPARFAIVGLGKLGSRELNYHSDLDVIFLYEDDGTTAPAAAGGASTTNIHFFSELAQRIIRTMSEAGPTGRLYDVDPRLRPTGKSGNLALPIAEFERYFASGEGHLWERQALTRARVVSADPGFAETVERALERAAYGRPWKPSDADEILAMRRRIEQSGNEHDLKRGPGGTVDLEFLAQTLLLRHAADGPARRPTHTLAAISALHAAGKISDDVHRDFHACYQFLGQLTKELRLMTNSARGRLPQEPAELEKLARRMGYAGRTDVSPAHDFLADLTAARERGRALFFDQLQALRREVEMPGGSPDAGNA